MSFDNLFYKRLKYLLPYQINRKSRYTKADSLLLSKRIDSFLNTFFSKKVENQKKTLISIELFQAYLEAELCFFSCTYYTNDDYFTKEKLRLLFKGIINFGSSNYLLTYYNQYSFISNSIPCCFLEKNIRIFVIRNYGQIFATSNGKVSFHHMYLHFCDYCYSKNVSDTTFFEFEIRFKFLFKNFFFSVIFPNQVYSDEHTYVAFYCL